MSVVFSIKPRGLENIKDLLKVHPIKTRRELVSATEDSLARFKSDVEPRYHGEGVQSQTGRLWAGFSIEVFKTRQGDVVGFAGHRRGKPPWARTHEFGATITPRKGRFLAIPIRAGRSADGRASYGSSLRNAGKTWLRPIRGRGGFAVLRGSKKAHEKVALLLPSVSIPARLGLRETWRVKTKPFVDYRFAQALRRIAATRIR